MIELKSLVAGTNENIELVPLAKLNIPYLIVLYGVGAEGKETIKDQFKNKYKPSFYEPILEFISMKPIKESKFHENWKSVNKIANKKNRIKAYEFIRELRNNPNYCNTENSYAFTQASQNKYPNNYFKFYGGHQYKLGHYFRHLFQTYTFINEHKTLNNEEKYFYAKTLRAQLSTAEQSLLFINSLSHQGLVWDLAPKINSNNSGRSRKKEIQRKRLITNYNLITNLPSQSIFGIRYRDYYPEVDYEIDFE